MSGMKEDKYKYANKDNRIIRNNMALLIGFAMFVIFLVIASISGVSTGRVSMMGVVVVSVVAVGGFIVMIILTMRNLTKTIGMKYSIFYLWALLFVGQFFIRMDFVMVFALFPIVGYVAYLESKVTLMASVGVVAISALSLIIGIFMAGSIVDVFSEVLLLISVALVSLSAVLMTNILSNYMSDTVGSLEEQKDEVRNMMQDVLSVAGEVRQGTSDVMEIVDKLTDSTHVVTGAVREISAGNLNTAENIQNQTEMTQNIQTSIDNILSMAKEMVDVARDSEEVDENSLKIVGHLKSQSEIISDTNAAVASTMKTLQEKASSVKGIVDTILSISNQTNLLALNASIESARAGEAGRGFAVVADEIRDLAEKTKTETENIASVLDELSQNAEAAARAVDSSVEATTAEEKLIDDASESFNEINKDIKILTKDIHEIDQMLHDLANENNRIVEAITQLSATSEEVSASSTQAESVSNENLENADNARNHLNQVIEVSTKLDKYTM